MQRPCQPAILEPVPALARFLELDLRSGADAKAVLARLRDVDPKMGAITGIGAPLASATGTNVPGLVPFPSIAGPAGAFPSTQRALWVCLSGADATELHDRARSVRMLLGDSVI